MSLKYRPETIIFLIIFIVGSFFLALKIAFGVSFLNLASFIDGYFRLANNLYYHHVFSLTSVLEPTALRVPGYPFFLAFIFAVFKTWWACLFAQIIILAFTSVIIYKIGRLISLGEKWSFAAALFFGLEPYALDISMQFLADNLFTFFLVLAVFIFLDYLNNYNPQKVLLLAIILTILTYIKPIGLFLSLIIFTPILVFYIFKKRQKIFQLILFFLLIYISCLAPWLLRNKFIFNSWYLSSDNASSFYSTALQFESWSRGEIFSGNINADFSKPINLDETLNHFEDAYFIIASNPIGFTKFYLQYFEESLVGSNWWGATRNLFLGRSGQVNYDKEVLNDIYSLNWRKIGHFPLKNILALAVMALGALFWLISIILFMIGAYLSIKNNADLKSRTGFFLLISTIVFFILTGALTVGDVVRCRLPVAPFIFVMAFCGLKYIYANIKSNNLLTSAELFLGLIKVKIFKKPMPLTVIYNITDHCNLKCEYCYADYYGRENAEPAKEQVFSVIDQLEKMGTKRISISGGEPLLRSDIGEIINYIKVKNLICTLNSNGVLVPAKIKELKNTDVLCLSLDGDEEGHDCYRGKGSFKKVMEAIKCAKENGLKIYTNTVLHAKNLEVIDFIMELAKESGIKAEFALLIGNIYEKDKEKNLRKATDEQYRQAIKKIIDYKRRGYPVVISEKAYQYALYWDDYKKEDFKKSETPNFPYIECGMAGQYFCCIDTDGKIYACPHLIGKQPAVSCYGATVKEAFSGISAPNCHACYQVYHNEFNLLFNLDFNVIVNYVKNTFN